MSVPGDSPGQVASALHRCHYQGSLSLDLPLAPPVEEVSMAVGGHPTCLATDPSVHLAAARNFLRQHTMDFWSL